MAARWYAVHFLPRSEATAQHHLERQGFETFVPRIAVTSRHARQLRTVKVPFFSRYGFVRLDLDRHGWRAVNGTVGVRSLVMALDRPCPVPVGVVEGLEALAAADGVIDPGRDLQPGDTVRLVSGPLGGTVGTLLRLDERGRVDLLLDVMGAAVRARVDRRLLEPAA